jgi:hypothetical protein
MILADNAENEKEGAHRNMVQNQILFKLSKALVDLLTRL